LSFDQLYISIEPKETKLPSLNKEETERQWIASLSVALVTCLVYGIHISEGSSHL